MCARSKEASGRYAADRRDHIRGFEVRIPAPLE